MILTTIFATAAGGALVLGAAWWLWAPLAAVALWGLAAFVVMRFVIRVNEISNLPAVSFLTAGASEQAFADLLRAQYVNAA